MFKLSRVLPAALLLVLLLALAGTAGASANELGEMLCEAEMEIEDYLTKDQYIELKQHLLETLQVDIITHVVQRGETLSAIARRYGVCVATISESNQLANPHLIYPGQELTFPSVKGLLYRVEEGDTLLSLAARFNVESGLLLFSNGLASIDLEPGQLIVIPGIDLPAPPQMVAVSRSYSSGSSFLLPRMVWPVQGTITSKFGARGGTHRGIDIAGGVGTPIRAAAAGEVIFSGWARASSGYGRMVIIRHNKQVQTLYAHASQLLVKVGDIVAQGDVIARVGTSGNTTGPHLHFEVLIDGTRINPLRVLPGY